MMMHTHPLRLILLGGLLLVLGFAGAFAMVIRVVEASFLLSFLSYGASLVGLAVGLIGVANYSEGGSGRLSDRQQGWFDHDRSDDRG